MKGGVGFPRLGSGRKAQKQKALEVEVEAAKQAMRDAGIDVAAVEAAAAEAAAAEPNLPPPSRGNPFKRKPTLTLKKRAGDLGLVYPLPGAHGGSRATEEDLELYRVADKKVHKVLGLPYTDRGDTSAYTRSRHAQMNPSGGPPRTRKKRTEDEEKAALRQLHLR
jgi:hypothetical protein